MSLCHAMPVSSTGTAVDVPSMSAVTCKTVVTIQLTMLMHHTTAFQVWDACNSHLTSVTPAVVMHRQHSMCRLKHMWLSEIMPCSKNRSSTAAGGNAAGHVWESSRIVGITCAHSTQDLADLNIHSYTYIGTFTHTHTYVHTYVCTYIHRSIRTETAKQMPTYKTTSDTRTGEVTIPRMCH